MDTTTTGTTALPTPSEPATTRKYAPRQVLNRKQLKELADARAVANAANDPANAPALVEVEIEDTLVEGTLALAQSTQELIDKLPAARVAKREMTQEEKMARDALIAVIAPIQTGARRKYFGPQVLLRGEYFIGQDLHSESLHEVMEAAQAIYKRLTPGPGTAPAADVLPGVKDAQIHALKDAITTHEEKVKGKADDSVDCRRLLEEIEANVTELGRKRHKIQLAAEQAFPHRNSLVRTIRETFLLPPDRPLPDGHQ